MSTIFGTNGAEALLGTATADAIHGQWGDDSLTGVAGRDFLYGGNGNDTLDGGAGPDLLDGGGGIDLALYTENTSPVWADLRTGVVSFPGRAWPAETLVSIEALDGGSSRDNFTGNGAGNLFRGNDGNDVLVGNIGSDTLVGGTGADSLDGGNGLDSLVGGFGNDTMRGGLHDDIFGIASIVGLDDPATMTTVDYGLDIIDGGAGSDTLVVEGPATNVVDESADPESGSSPLTGAPPVRANLNLGTLRLGDSENRSRLISIENIETGSGDDSINGSTGDNFIQAGAGQNVVYAGGGNDTIVGGSVTYSGSTGEEIVEVLNGGNGDDVIYGMGSEFIFDDNATTHYTMAGEDVLVGGEGNDTLYGGGAIHTMSGGSGRDVFVLTDQPNTEYYYYDLVPDSMNTTTIVDFERGQDSIRFEIVRAGGITRLVGEVDPEEVGSGEVGYYQSGGDTILEFRSPVSDVYADEILTTIVLTDYTGPLSASDFDFG